ncbi:MAG: heme biosynthesis HemY N-terminal domain-containing protein [Pseudomonadota bacterium]
MLRLVIYFLGVAVIAFGLSLLADNPGRVEVNWQGYIWDTDLFQVTILLSFLAATVVFIWTVLHNIWQSPAAIGNFLSRRREKRGLEALSSGMIAIGAGDRTSALRYATQARISLPNEPMTHLLRAQAAQLAGDHTTSRRIFEAMLATPDTEALGLRGLFLEAECEGEVEAARQFAERAVKLNPKLSWPVKALFDIQCKSRNWNGALATLAIAKKHGHVEKQSADRRRAVLLSGLAQEAEDTDSERALGLALEAHNLAPDLVPAAAVAGRLLAARGNTSRATKILQKTWKKSSHPELAVAYAHARLGDSPRDRLKRVQDLAALTPNIIESPIAVANAAIEARVYDVARAALAPLTEGRLTQRVCTLMARIEDEDMSNTGGVREWLARAVNAPRDPAWTADGIISETWQPVSPVTGALDAFQWRVPVEAAEPCSKEVLSQHIEELVKLGMRPETVIDQLDKGQSEQSAAGADTNVQKQISIPAAAKAEQVIDAEISKVRHPSVATANTNQQPARKDDDFKIENASSNQSDDKGEVHKETGNQAYAPQKDASAPSEKKSGAASLSGVEALSEPQDQDNDVSGDDKPGKNIRELPQVKKAKGLPVEPKIFVPPRASDDQDRDRASKKH